MLTKSHKTRFRPKGTTPTQDFPRGIQFTHDGQDNHWYVRHPPHPLLVGNTNLGSPLAIQQPAQTGMADPH